MRVCLAAPLPNPPALPTLSPGPPHTPMHHAVREKQFLVTSLFPVRRGGRGCVSGVMIFCLHGQLQHRNWTSAASQTLLAQTLKGLNVSRTTTWPLPPEQGPLLCMLCCLFYLNVIFAGARHLMKFEKRTGAGSCSSIIHRAVQG